jgi:pyruvate/2-oxoacid:ferredoxin oxidoreductase alpha subunit
MTGKSMSLTGNQAAGWAGRLAKISVALSFPMGPNAEVTETLQLFKDKGEMPDLRVVYGDNEKSTASIQIGIGRLGVRSMMCINSEGLLWATPETHYGASCRLPLLIVCPSRTLEPPTNVYTDQDDFILQRDMGWLMFYCEDAQDILDTVIQTYKVIENESVMLPAIIGYDGWETSHSSSRVNIPSQEEVDSFLPRPSFIKPEKDYLQKDWKERCKHRRMAEGYGGSYTMELRQVQKEAEKKSAELIESIGEEYQNLFGRRHVGLLEVHECGDAELILVTMGIQFPVVRFAVDALRKDGIKIGCVKVRAFKPFPLRALRDAVKDAKLVVTIERNSVSALFSETKSALYPCLSRDSKRLPMVMGWVVGIGGEAVSIQDVGNIIDQAFEASNKGEVSEETIWLCKKSIKFDPTRDIIAD